MFNRYWRWVAIALFLSDALLINLGFILAYWVRYEWQLLRPVEEAYFVPYTTYLPAAGVFTLILLIAYWLEGMYAPARRTSWFDQVFSIFNGTTSGTVIMIVANYIYPSLSYSRLIFLYATVLIVVLLSISRLLLRAVLGHLRRRGIGVSRVLIVGAGSVGRTVMRNIVAQPSLGYQIVGFVDDNPNKGSTDIGRFKALGPVDNLARIIQQENIDEVIITLPWMYHRKIISVMSECQRERVRARLVPDLFQMTLSKVDVDDLGGVPLVGVREIAIPRWKLAAKRALDFSISLMGLVLCWPLFLLIALAIKLDSPGPVLFKQVRVGKGGKEFELYKFRTMRVGAEEEQAELRAFNEATGPLFKIRDDPRLTRVGKFLRRTSLDELPQVYNVLRGEMSLVGPRPPLPSEVAEYLPWQRQRLEVSPGMTGLWQVSGRSELTFDEMCLLDIYYIENWSPTLDAEILLRTIPNIIFGKGAY
ncbi:MAG: undecaprenyl-phosphate glucose phosphotransferase [Anaerolineae bacterium]|nr:undecaprenyl-phosphate glucose phosphotransferase [Anaerolineae bacterium]MDH7475020.1 undecaprenyl-phosphate glucose phosphotransferase [Anaerolineae bacterium]